MKKFYIVIRFKVPLVIILFNILFFLCIFISIVLFRFYIFNGPQIGLHADQLVHFHTHTRNLTLIMLLLNKLQQLCGGLRIMSKSLSMYTCPFMTWSRHISILISYSYFLYSLFLLVLY